MIVDDFFEMEERHKLFSLETEEGWPVWDIVRMYVYLKYHFPDAPALNVGSSKKITDYLDFVTKSIKSVFLFLFKKGDNFFLPLSRYKGKDGLYYDKATLSAIEALKGKCFVFEIQGVGKRYKYSCINNYSEYFKKLSKNKIILTFDNYEKIEEALKNTFHECKVTYDELNKLLKDFEFEYLYYKRIFKFKKVKRIFINSSGYRKGLFRAAHELKIPVFELQHGSFERDHLAYSYPTEVGLNSNIIVPDFLLTFGDYWGSYFNVPIHTRVSIGNNSFFTDQSDAPDNSILIVSSAIHGKELYIIAKELALKFPEKTIKYKLHSNEYYLETFYSQQFEGINNIIIFKDQKDVSQLLANCDLVILINSTVLYEALNQNKRVAIYKKVNYMGLSNLFKMPNVFLFETVTEIDRVLEMCTCSVNTSFFKPFDIELFYKITNI